MKSKEEIKELIYKFESEAGESFNDYFSHDNINDGSWAFWLLGKGYSEHANNIIELIDQGETCIDQEVLYDIYPEYDENGKWVEDSAEKNIEIMAEFLSSNRFYHDKFNKFITNFLEGNPY